MHLVYGADRPVAQYIADKLAIPSAEPGFISIGLVDDDHNPIGGVIFSKYIEGEDILMTLAADVKRHPKIVRVMGTVLEYAFGQLDLPRVSAEISRHNTACIRLAEWLGFRMEGPKRGSSLINYGLTRTDWEHRCELHKTA